MFTSEKEAGLAAGQDFQSVISKRSKRLLQFAKRITMLVQPKDTRKSVATARWWFEVNVVTCCTYLVSIKWHSMCQPV